MEKKIRIGIDMTGADPDFGGGKQQFVYNLVRGWQQIGYADELTLFVRACFVELIKKLAPEAALVVVPDRYGFLPKKLLRDIIDRTVTIPRMLRKMKIDVFFFPDAFTGCKKYHVPTAVNPHDIQFIEFPKRAGCWQYLKYRFFYGCDFRLRDVVVSISSYDRQAICRHYPYLAERIQTLSNPIRFTRKTLRTEKAKSTAMILAVNIGFVHKNVGTLVRAFEMIANTVDCELILVGRLYKETEYIKEMVEKSKVHHKITLTGYVSEERLDSLYAKSSIYVNPSYYEGFGMTAVEAMGAAIPVLTTRHPAIVESTLGLANYYEPAKSAEALAKKLLEMLEDPPTQEELASLSARVIAQYDQASVAKQYRMFLHTLAIRQPKRNKARSI